MSKQTTIARTIVRKIARKIAPLVLLLLWPALALAQAAPEQYPPPPGYAPPPNNYPPQGYGSPPPNNYPPPQGYGPPPGNYPPPPPPGYGYPPPRGYGYGRPVVYQAPVYQHEGFYLHLHVGGGYTSLSATNAGDKMTISGGSVSFGVAAGGAIAPNLILFGTLYGNTISDPNISYNGVNAGVASGTSASLIGIGIGLAYYVMPINVYFAGAISATWLDFSDDTSDSPDNTIFETNTGIGFQGLVGKEWWISQDWGLGVAGELTLASMKDSDYSDVRWTGGSFSLLFSATYN